MMVVFIPWDIWFTEEGVWWFNHDYTLGIDIFGLPIEEWLFFIVIPAACVFIYESLNHFIARDFLGSIAQSFFFLYAIVLIILAFIFKERLYPSVTFGATALFVTIFAYKQPSYIGRFLLMYFVVWIPFLVVNGSLTGLFTEAAVVNYNPNEFIGFRILTIPVEDSVYNLMMLLFVMVPYLGMQRKKLKIQI